jgi:hypothetical protein
MRTTRLKAVNIALQSAQIATVESLSSGDVDAEIAETILDENTVEVQTRGWNWNTEIMILAPDQNGHIILPDSFLKADATDAHHNVSQRGTKLYDLDSNSYIFTSKVELVIVVGLEYEELPESARRYIAYKTARIFQQRTLGEPSLNNMIANEEQIAWSQMLNEDIESADYNHITSSPISANSIRRVSTTTYW